jgi:hypothetical protein
MMHAGSFLSCWLGFAQVGLGSNLTHGVTLTSFLLAPSPRHELAWRDTDFSRVEVQFLPHFAASRKAETETPTRLKSVVSKRLLDPKPV